MKFGKWLCFLGTGQYGHIVSRGFRFGGDAADGNKAKINLTGLTDGQAYVFALYSQAWSRWYS